MGLLDKVGGFIGKAGQTVSQGLLAGPERHTLDADQRREAGQQGLRDMGLSLLMSGGPPGGGRNAPTTLAAIAAGAQAGRASYRDTAERLRAAETTVGIEEAMADGYSPEALQNAFTAAIEGGDLETARSIGPILQQMISSQATSPNTIKETTDPLTGEKIFFDMSGPAPREIMRIGAGMEGDILPSGLQQERGRILSRLATRSSGVTDVANSYRRVLSATNTLLNYDKAVALAKQRGESLPARPTAAAMAAISSFARLLDPGSVVREGEFHIVSNQGSAVDRIKRWYETIMQGMIPDGLAQALQDEAFRQTTAQRTTMNEINETAWEQGMAAGIKKKWMPLENPFASALAELRAGTLEFDMAQHDQEQQGASQNLTEEQRKAALDEILGR